MTGERAEGRPETPPGLERVISAPVLLLVVLGTVLGTGIYALTGPVVELAGGATWAAFLVALALVGVSAFAYAELATKYPLASGAALYVQRAFGRPWMTFLVGLFVLASGLAGVATAAAAFSGDYFAVLVDLPRPVVTVAFLFIVGVVCARDVRLGTRANVVFTLVEVAGLVLIVAVGVAALASGEARPERALQVPEGSTLVPAVASGAALAVFALLGFEDSANLAEETRRPSIAFPIALFGGLGLATLLYVLVTVAAVAVVDPSQLAGSTAALLDVVRGGPLPIPPRLFTFFGLFAVTNNAIINLLMASRLLYGMARQGVVPSLFGRVSPRLRTPVIAVAAATAVAVALAFTGELTALAETTTLLLLIVVALVNISALAARRDRVDHEHFRAPSAQPVLGVASSLGLIATQEAGTFLRAAGLVAVGLALYGVQRVTGAGRDVDTRRS